VDVEQEVEVNAEDCGATKRMIVSDIKDNEEIDATLYDRV